MKDLFIRALLLKGFNQDDRTATFICSTDCVDRYDEVVAQNWRLDNYRANPVALFAHLQRELPIGQAIAVAVEGGELVATIKFASARANPLAENVWQSIVEGTLRAVSVGFYPHTVRWEKRLDQEVLVLDDNELFEISVVPVPANPEALAKARARAFEMAKREAPAAESPPAEPSPSTAAPSPDAPAPSPEPAPAPEPSPAEPPAPVPVPAPAPAPAEPPTSPAPKSAPVDDEDEAEVIVHIPEEDEEDEQPPPAEKDAPASPRHAPKAPAVQLGAEELRTKLAKAEKERDALVDQLTRKELEPMLGDKVEPWEVEHLVKLKKASPELYEGERKRHEKRAPQGLKQRALPGDVPGAGLAADPAAQLNAALERNKKD